MYHTSKIISLHTTQSVPVEATKVSSAAAGVVAAADELEAAAAEPEVPKGKVFACAPFFTLALVAGSKKTLGSLAGS